jgi:predicted O-methyltransferase YrrM
MMSFMTFEQCAATIPYQYRHPRFLHALIRWLRPRHVVEVGTHIGMSAVWMARALQENGEGHLWCIDSFCWHDQPTQEAQWNRNINLCGVRDMVTLVKGRSQQVEWPPRVDFAYIDGAHTETVCYHDVEKARSLGATCLCLNDTVTCEGVSNATNRLRQIKDWDFLEVNFDAGLLIALKREPKKEPIQGNVDPWDDKVEWQPLPNFQGES